MHRCEHHGRQGQGALIAMMMGGWGRGGDYGRDGPFGPNGPFGRNGSYAGSGRRGRSRMFGAGELRLVLMGLVGEAPRHGYELIKAIEELSGGHYTPSPGVVYPTLNLLTDEKAIELVDTAGVRRAYGLTASGRAELDERIEEFRAIIERLTALAQEEERHSAPPLKRAIGNLLIAVRQRMSSGGGGRETIHQVAEILDEAAHRIERL